MQEDLPEGWYYPRERATQYDMWQREQFLINYANQHGPVTVRGLYYQAEVAGLPGIDKTESGYNKIQRQVLLLRREGKMPYRCIADATRWMRKPTSFNNPGDALWNWASTYRRSLWRDTKAYVEIWCEKDALAGVVFPVTSENDVPLMVTRGYSSETFAYEAVAARIDQDTGQDYHVYYLGDFDRSGRDAANSLKLKLERFAEGQPWKVIFHDLAVTEQQVAELGLSTREPKRKSSADKLWPHDFACELDAIEADTIRDLVRSAIEIHLPADQLAILKTVEASEREGLMALAGQYDEDNQEDDDDDGS